MSDTRGLPNADEQGVPEEEDPQRFEGAEAPPADFDPAQQPSNPDLVEGAEPPDE
jgi:hypothetical protein